MKLPLLPNSLLEGLKRIGSICILFLLLFVIVQTNIIYAKSGNIIAVNTSILVDTLNDFREGAIELTDISGWCSQNAEFNNQYGTPDGDKPSGWDNGPNYNVWFKFKATSAAVNIQVKSGGEFGTLLRPQIALFNDSETELISNRNPRNNELQLSYNQLLVDNWYYFSVDVHDPYDNNNRQGTFTLCIDDEVSNDFKEGAIVLTDLTDWCSQNAEFSNIYGTPDGNMPSGWSYGPKYNVWFKFQATTNSINIEAKSGGAYGSLTRPQLALYSETGNELVSNRNTRSNELQLSYNQLTINDWYYFVVDTHDPYDYDYRQGTFTLCVDDEVSNDFIEGAIVITDITDWCSQNAEFSNIYGTADGDIPSGWDYGPKYNVWFKFQATTTATNIQVRSGGEFGNLTRPQLALYDESGTELISNENTRNDILQLSYNQLAINDWYYFAVDTHDPYDYDYRQGTFTLCLDDEVSNDFKEGAIILANTSNWCSQNAEFTNLHGTPDGAKPSGWDYGPKYNVWFKFQAESVNISIQVKSSGIYGNLTRPQLALYNDAAQELASDKNIAGDQLELSYGQLIIDDWYYFAVDTHDPWDYGYRPGDFSICLGYPPNSPSNLITSNNTNGIELNWIDMSNNEEGFVIERELDNYGFAYLDSIKTSDQIQFIDNNVIAGSSYNYRIKTFNAYGTSDWSNIASVTHIKGEQVSDTQELQALEAIYNKLGGQGWTNSTNWLNGTSSSDFAGWYGITVENGDVTEVDLQSNNLKGEIPPEIQQLGYLRVLRLNNNQLDGEIPMQLARLVNLEEVHLNDNQLEGYMDLEFCVMPNIRVMALQNNNLVSIPDFSFNKVVNFQQVTLNAENNKLEFYYIENNLNTDGTDILGTFTYMPQKTYGEPRIIGFIEGNELNLKVNMLGRVNHYQWQFSSDQGQSWTNVGDNNPGYSKFNIKKEDDEGWYRVRITNDRADEAGDEMLSEIYNLRIEKAPVVINRPKH